MKLLVVCSAPEAPGLRPGAFERRFGSAWADRFLQHLANRRELCTGCGDACVHCRDWRARDYRDDLAGVIRLPAVLPELLDDPAEYFPDALPPHDVLVAIEIHEEILMELPRRCREAGGRAVIAPVEAPQWMSRWARGKFREAGRHAGVETAAPKPFCALERSAGPAIAAFIEHFCLGRPEIEIEVLDGRLARVTAHVTAPCGNSHYVAHCLQGFPLSEALQFEVCRYWHSYPCTAGMKQDPDLGDTILHRGGQIHMEAFCGAAGVPHGRVVGCTPTVKKF
ncbi:MAG: hypothetical protein C4524_00955 [Candidatus Zixiibacteriota bacterium]|nr:MAG: hypothetical protein C4524_00955 [candidate division Zixibacteria bacterium]